MNDLFGRYQILEPLAVGGMAEVFRAQTAGASGFLKEVVIKRILPSYSEDPHFVKMFVDEARIAARLHHPNIVQVFDFDVVDGTYYIAMEYVEGVDLSTFLETASRQGTRLELSECFFVVKEIAKALDYAHRRRHKGRHLNIIHRDVSPHNIMVSFEGAVKLTDFGIAKASSRATRTQEGIVKGKTAYMSPEQAAGESLDPRSDLFSLGILFFELVAMRRLFVGDSEREILLKVIDANIPSPTAYRRDLPAAAETVIRTLLERRRERRYANAELLLKDIGRLYRQIAETAAETSLRERLKQMFPERFSHATSRSAGSWPAQPPDAGGAPATPVRAVSRHRPPAIPADAYPHSGDDSRDTERIPVPVRLAQHAPSTIAATSGPPAGNGGEGNHLEPQLARQRGAPPFKRQSVVSGPSEAQASLLFEQGTRLYQTDNDATQITKRPLQRLPKSRWWILLVVILSVLFLSVLIGSWLDPFSLRGE